MATVIGILKDASGGKFLSTIITFETLSAPTYVSGALVAKTFKEVPSDANGAFSVVLEIGDYKVSFWNGLRLTEFQIAVPSGSATVPIEAITTSSLTYTYSAPAQSGAYTSGYDTIAALRAAVAGGATNKIAAVFGNAVAGDWPTRLYRWDGASMAADDGDQTIKPTVVGGASPGRWLNSPQLLSPGYDTLADLRLVTGSANNKLAVNFGNVAAGDWPSRLYRWDAASVLADDADQVIKPTAIGGASPGRWRLSPPLLSPGYDTLAEFRLTTGSSANKFAALFGNAVVGDLPTRFYRWDAASVLADDADQVIKPTAVSGAGRWIKLVITTAQTNGHATLAALRAAAAGYTAHQLATLLGETVIGDIFARTYRWDTASTAVDEGFLVVKPDSTAGGSPGRWLKAS